MRIAILNAANNITKYHTVASAETLYLADLYRKLNHEVKVISKTTTENTFSFEDAPQDPNYFDKIIMLNGAVGNFFGGKENEIITSNFKYLAKYNKPVYYFLTDLRYPFEQLWPHIEKRGWGYTEEDVYVKEVIVVSQAHNLEEVINMHKAEEVKEVRYAPLERYKLLFQEEAKPQEKTVDLIYGGSFRSGKREKAMLDFFFDTNYSVELYGTIKQKQFKKYKGEGYPTFTGKQKAENIIEYNGKAYATLIIGDNNYNNNIITLRVWEALMSDCIILIDKNFDLNQDIMGHGFFYVKDKFDIAHRIRTLKENNNFDKIMEIQKARLKELFNEEDYLREMNEAIK